MPNLDKLRIDSKNALERAKASEESSIHSQVAMSAVIQNESSTRAIESRSASLQGESNVLHKEQEVLNQSIEEEQIEATLHPQRLQEVKESAELDQMLFEQVQSILGSFSEIENKRLNQSSLMIETISSEAIKYTEEAKNAIKQSSIESLIKILDKISDINYQDSDGRTLLMHALSNGFFPAVDILLGNPDINLDILDDKGQNAIFYACSMPHIDYVEKILNRTKDINIIVPDTGNTPLHQVVSTTSHILFGDEYTKYYDLLSDGSDTDYIDGWRGSLSTKNNVSIGLGGNPSTYHSINQAKTLLIVDKFLEKGVDLNTQNNRGHTPFTIACGNNLKYITNQWLDKGLVDINFQDHSGQTLLYWMCLWNNSDMVEYLLNKDADHNITEKQGFYPIHAATHYNFVEVINVLLANGVDINIKSQDGVTPLYYSLANGRQKINIDLVKFLLGKGADPNIEHQNGFYPVHAAINSKDVDVLQLFVKNSEDANKTGANGTTPLYFAVNATGDIEIVNYLLEKGALPNAVDKDRFTPIYSATQHGRLDIIKTLVSKGAHIEEATECGDTPIAMAAYKGHIDIIKYFEDLGANLNIKNKNGDMPIHEAHMGARIGVVDYLIEKNANINAGNLQGKTPLHFLLEWKDTPLNEKIALLSKYIKQYDLSLQDKNGKTPIDYAEEQCPEAIEYLILDSFTKDASSTNTSVHSSIFDDSQSLIASHATSETEVMGDQDSYSGI